MDGNFSIEVPANATLQISFIGYIPQDIVVKNQNVINVLLKEDTQALEEVVVVGYGTMKKKDMTGAVASVKMDDTPVATVSTVCRSARLVPSRVDNQLSVFAVPLLLIRRGMTR